MADLLTMSMNERERLKVLERLGAGTLTAADAADLLGIGQRQLRRIRTRYHDEGDAGIIHRLRGSRSNRGHPPALRTWVCSLYRERYGDYGPTLFAEILADEHDVRIAPETLRQWLMADGQWQAQQQRRRHRKRRARRGAIGELLQFDGSHHDWFEGRAPQCCLLVAIDDASNRVFMRFAKSESTRDILLTLWAYVESFGIPQSIYTDGGSAYYSINGKPTNVALALEAIGVTMIRAHSAQAKGRVERSNRTHQDRLVKAMRQAGISSIAAANEFLEKTYLPKHNERFVIGEALEDLHRPIDGIDLRRIFCYRHSRVVRNDYTVCVAGQALQLLRQEATLPRPRSRVDIEEWLDRTVVIRWRGEALLYAPVQARAPGSSPARSTGSTASKPRRPVVQSADHSWRRMGTLGDKAKNTTARAEQRKRRAELRSQSTSTRPTD